MAASKNRWFIGAVLIFSLAALLAVSLLPLFGDTSRRTSTAGSTPTSNAQAELESRARGYELVLQREPDNKAALEGLVEARIQLGDLQGVVDPLTKLADLNPEIADYRVLLGQAKQEMGDLEGAAQAYRQVLDQQPGNMNALQGLVALLVQQNRSQAAVGLLQDTLSDAEKLGAGSNAVNTTSVRLLLADVYVRDQKVDQALKLYDEAIQGAPEDFRPVLAKALVLRGQDRQDEAKPLFDQALAMAPAQYKDQIQQMATQGEAAPQGSPQPAPAAPTEPATPSTGDLAPAAPAAP